MDNFFGFAVVVTLFFFPPGFPNDESFPEVRADLAFAPHPPGEPPARIPVVIGCFLMSFLKNNNTLETLIYKDESVTIHTKFISYQIIWETSVLMHQPTIAGTMQGRQPSIPYK